MRSRCLALLVVVFGVTHARAQSVASVPYGNAGDPYETEGGSASCKKHLNACGKNLGSGDFCLDSDVTAKPDNSGVCFEFSAHTRLDLQGHTIQGRVVAHGDAQGAHLFNGSITCEFADQPHSWGCLSITANNTSGLDEPAELHHLIIRNLAVDHSARGVFVDWSPAERKPRFALRIYHTTISTAKCAADPLHVCTRTINVRVQSQAKLSVEAFANDWTCSADTNACQGIEMFEIPDARIHHNRIDMKTNTGIVPETGRAIDCDANHVPGSRNCEVDSNLIIVNNNRALRVRSSADAYFHDNQVVNCTNKTIGCIHIYDQHSMPENYGHLVVEHNQFQVNGGTLMFMRCGWGALIRNNSVDIAAPGLFAIVSTWGAGCTTDVTFEHNGIAGTPNIKVVNGPTGGATATICDSGEVTGSGRITRSDACNSPTTAK